MICDATELQIVNASTYSHCGHWQLQCMGCNLRVNRNLCYTMWCVKHVNEQAQSIAKTAVDRRYSQIWPESICGDRCERMEAYLPSSLATAKLPARFKAPVDVNSNVAVVQLGACDVGGCRLGRFMRIVDDKCKSTRLSRYLVQPHDHLLNRPHHAKELH